MKQRPVKTEYNFSKQRARRQRRREEAELRVGGLNTGGGLREQIANAVSETEIKGHLANGIIRYTGASAKTRRQWSATANRRTEQLATDYVLLA